MGNAKIIHLRRSFLSLTLHPCLSAFIRVQKSSEFVGATRRVAPTGFGVKGDKALFLTLGIFHL